MEAMEIPSATDSSKTQAQMMAERKLARMRLGQGVADIESPPSDSEIRFAIVPLTEAEYEEALLEAAKFPTPDNAAGWAARERRNAVEQLVRSLREPEDHNRRAFKTVEEIQAALDQDDIDFLFDKFEEQRHKASPSLDGISPEEFEVLKKVLQNLDWNALSGRAWYAAKRFLSTISDQLLLGNSVISSSTSKSTTKND